MLIKPFFFYCLFVNSWAWFDSITHRSPSWWSLLGLLCSILILLKLTPEHADQ